MAVDLPRRFSPPAFYAVMPDIAFPLPEIASPASRISPSRAGDQFRVLPPAGRRSPLPDISSVCLPCQTPLSPARALGDTASLLPLPPSRGKHTDVIPTNPSPVVGLGFTVEVLEYGV